jgi:glycosyltransferase involved in cell wall biosynthesis
MLVTAHGGALGTHRNSKSFFENISGYAVDVVEVDIWKAGGLLYLSHLPSLIPSLRLPLSHAFEYIKERGFKINCDVKQRGLVKPVLDLAQKIGVLPNIIFTGSVCENDVKDLYAGEVYLNKSFFKLRGTPTPADVSAMKARIDSFKCERLKGLNLRFTICTEEFLAECKKQELPVSVFVVDQKAEMERLSKHPELANITTNRPDELLTLLGRKIYKD